MARGEIKEDRRRLIISTQVVIDDRLPTRDNRLVFLNGGKPNEFWPALFEKAYAKFYGGYHNIEGGTSLEAGVDFTGILEDNEGGQTRREQHTPTLSLWFGFLLVDE